VLNVLARLLDKSLVTTSEQGGGLRYAMLETIREYARERLVEAGEERPLLERHRDWFLRFAEAAERKLQGPEQSAWFARLEADHDNLRAVLARCEREWPGSDTALRLCCAIRYFWYVRGHTVEGRRWLEAALGAGGPAASELRATAHYGASGLALAQADYVGAEAHLRRSLELYRGLGNSYGAIHVLLRLAFLYEATGDYDATIAASEEALALSRAGGNRNEVAVAQYYVGRVALGRGDLDRAALCFEEGLAVHRETGNRRYVAIMLHSLGELAHRRGELGRAEAILGECIAIARELGDTRLLADALTVLGSVAGDGGDHERALATHREALAAHWRQGDLGGAAYALGGIACAMAARGRPHDALVLAGAASKLHEEVKSPPSPAEQADLDRHLRPARDALGAEEAARAFDEGRALDNDAAVRRALASGPE
jgi:tetratricopeptide (TPR) repeat protein